MLEEFGLPVDVHLGIDGTVTRKVGQITDSFGQVLAQLLALDLTPVPYIHGDTMTSMAVAVASYLSQVACVHVEAGIRTITPRREVLDAWLASYRSGDFDWEGFARDHRDPATFERGSREPFPE